MRLHKQWRHSRFLGGRQGVHIVIYEVDADIINTGAGRMRRKANSGNGRRPFDGFLYFHKFGFN
jgi:hypothetical protein